MADPNDDVELPQATAVAPRRSRLSIVWIIPVLAALVGVGIAVQRIRSEGPTITIVFKAAEGIEAGKTFIKYKDVIIGQVKTVQFTEDYANVEITAKISKRAAGSDVKDGDILTACQQACATEAIVFGNYNEKDSQVNKLRENLRSYQVLEELNTRTRTRYLAKLRNPSDDAKAAGGHES
jgi:hypothetical protein